MGLLEGERSNGERVKILGTKKVKGAMEKGWRLGLLEGKRGNGERVIIYVVKNVTGALKKG